MQFHEMFGFVSYTPVSVNDSDLNFGDTINTGPRSRGLGTQGLGNENVAVHRLIDLSTE